MSKRVNKFATAQGILAAAVADDGTFTVAYPTGTSQLSFNAGLAGAGHYVIFNDNDKVLAADPGIGVSFGASEITVTNLTGAALPAGTTFVLHLDMVDGLNRLPLVIPLPPLATITAADIVTEMRPGVAGYIEHAEFVTTVAATTAAKAATLNLEIDATNVEGGTIALTSAAVTPKGKAIAAAAITGSNRLTKESKLSVEAASVTAFVEGEGFLVVYIRLDQDDEY